MEYQSEKGVFTDQDMQLTEDERGMVQGGSSMDTASNNYQSSAEHAKLASDLKAYE